MEKKGRLVYFNGKLVPESEARISIYDSALMFGDMVFEMMRTFNKKQFKLRWHLERLYTSIKHVNISINMPIDEMEKVFYETVDANMYTFDDKDEIRSLVNVSRGPLYIYRHIFDNKLEPTVIIACFPLKWIIGHMARYYDMGVHAVIPRQKAIPADLMDPKVKHRSRLYLQMANIEAAQGDPEAWALMLDPDGFIAEATGANFFMVKDNKLYTPEPRNILKGISRRYVMEELAPELSIPCSEKNIRPQKAYESDEAFFTGTPFCIMPISRIDGRVLGSAKPSSITRKLLDLWSKNVGVDIVEQVKYYEKVINE